MRKTSLAAACAFLCFVGCTYTDGGSPVIDPALPGTAAAVVVGLTKVNPTAYGGWSGECPGCDNDMNVMLQLCGARGIPATSLFNETATQFRFLSACATAALSLRPAAEAGRSPLLLIYVSGHGGQVPDLTGDESDGMSETICLWDGPLVDDILWAALCSVPAGVRVSFITDTCNSGSNYRAPAGYGRAIRARRNREPGVISCSLLHFGGCNDGESSYGFDSGGVFTSKLSASLPEASTWADWFKSAASKMPRNQTPVMVEVGPSFSHLRPME